MTEQMAIEHIKYRYNIAKRMVGKGVNSNDLQDIEVALKALEEIQQYRAIGTVMQVEALKKLCELQEALLKQYQPIGTVDELQALKEKSVAKKPKFVDTRFRHHGRNISDGCSLDKCYECPTCRSHIFHVWESEKCCRYCGQLLDWE